MDVIAHLVSFSCPPVPAGSTEHERSARSLLDRHGGTADRGSAASGPIYLGASCGPAPAVRPGLTRTHGLHRRDQPDPERWPSAARPIRARARLASAPPG